MKAYIVQLGLLAADVGASTATRTRSRAHSLAWHRRSGSGAVMLDQTAETFLLMTARAGRRARTVIDSLPVTPPEQQ